MVTFVGAWLVSVSDKQGDSTSTWRTNRNEPIKTAMRAK